MIKLNNKEINYGMFPNGEMYITISALRIYEQNDIKFVYDNQLDIVKLILLQQHIKDCGFTSRLYIQYLPYSRMDRINANYSFSLKAISGLLNFLEFTDVVIREPHSAISLDLVNNSISDNWCERHLDIAALKSGSDSIFFPDKGAADRYIVSNMPVSFGKKNRDFATGEITSFGITGGITENILIVDDICSKGGTFIFAAKKLHEAGAKKISLLVAYCEENIHNGDIFDYIDKVYTSADCSVKDCPQIIKI